MRKLRLTVIAALLESCAFAAFPMPGFAQTCLCPGAGIHAETAPPPLPIYDQPPIPAPGYMWTPGYWAWNNYDYYWVPGTWVEPPRAGLLWTPGYWAFNNGVYIFNAGYWGQRVGFYGGIPYGFGYTGGGYEGGYWNNGAFFYNRSVNNINNTNITNVYNQAIVSNTTTNASYNGGAGGIAAKPTAEQEAAAKEQHVQATPTQVEHTRAASMNSALFTSTNKGKPAIAATARPAAFNGPGVSAAKDAISVSAKPATERASPNTVPAPAATPGGAIKPIQGGEPLPVPPKALTENPPSTQAPAPHAGSNVAPKAHGATQPVPSPGSPKPLPAPSGDKAAPVKPTAPAQHNVPAPAVQKPPPVRQAAPPAPRHEKENCGRPGLPACPK